MSTKPMNYAEYMTPSANSAEAYEKHHQFYLQLATPSTFEFVRQAIGMDRLRKSKDKHLNDIGIKHTQGGAGSWVWDSSPLNLTLARELGAVPKGCYPSPSTCTCVGKAAARELLRREGIIHE